MKMDQHWCENVMKRVSLAGPLPKDYAEVDLVLSWAAKHLTEAQLKPWIDTNLIAPHYTWIQTRNQTFKGRTYDLILHIWNKGDVAGLTRGYNGDGDLLQKMYNCMTVPDAHPDDEPSSICSKSLWDHYICSKTEILALKYRRMMFEQHLNTFIIRGARSFLDLGSGNGSYARHAYERLRDLPEAVSDPVVALDKHYLPVIDGPGPVYMRGDVVTDIPQGQVDIVYSGGLFEYLNDGEFRKVLTSVRNINPRFIMIGNFEQTPKGRALMHCLGWDLFNRSRWDLFELSSNIFSGAKNINVMTDPTGCQHFLVVEV